MIVESCAGEIMEASTRNSSSLTRRRISYRRYLRAWEVHTALMVRSDLLAIAAVNSSNPMLTTVVRASG